jgi:hypothetical protein
MTGKAKAKVMAAIKLAEDIGAQEIVEELQELLGMDSRRECKKSMDANGMTMYCTGGCCPDYEKCRKAEANVARGDMADHNRANWFGDTGDQPSEPVSAG